MSVFRACLWKEWREQRGLLGLLAGAIALLAAIAVLGFERHLVVREGFLPMVASAGLVLAAIATSARLLGSDLTGPGLDLLRRMPAGLAAPFTAKLVVYAGAIVVVPAWAALATLALRAWWIGPSSCDPWSLAERWELLLPFALIAVALFAVSTWVPRSGWATPACLLVTGLWSGPALIAAQMYPELTPRLARLALAAPLLVLPLLLGAAWSFIAGYRFGFTPARAGVRGSIMIALVAAPVWGWTAHTVHHWVHLAPTDADARIHDGFVGAGGRFAYLRYVHDGEITGQKGHGIRVDLVTGDWCEMGGYARYVDSVGSMDQSTSLTGSTALPELLLLEDLAAHRYDPVDARTGAILDVPLAELRERARASKRLTTPLRIDGRRAWFHYGRLECEDDAGGWRVESALELVGGQRVVWGGPFSNGPALLRQLAHDTVVVPIDLYRARLVEKQDVGDGWRCELVLPCGWLVRAEQTAVPRGSPGPTRPWFLHDPATGARTRLTCLGPDDWIAAMHDDGRVWVLEEQDHVRNTGRLFLVDVPSGVREEISCPAIGRDDFVRGFGNPGWPMAPAHTPAGARVYAVKTRGDVGHLARFDESTRTLVPALGDRDGQYPRSFLALPDEDSAILVRDGRTLIRVHFGSDACEVLFPRAE